LKDLKDILRTERVLVRMSLRTLENKIGYSSSLISEIELGKKNPTVKFCKKFCKIFNYSQIKMKHHYMNDLIKRVNEKWEE